MKTIIKRTLLGMLVLLVIREVAGLFEWFIIRKKTWADFRNIGLDEVLSEMQAEKEFYRRLATRRK